MTAQARWYLLAAAGLVGDDRIKALRAAQGALDKSRDDYLAHFSWLQRLIIAAL